MPVRRKQVGFASRFKKIHRTTKRKKGINYQQLVHTYSSSFLEAFFITHLRRKILYILKGKTYAIFYPKKEPIARKKNILKCFSVYRFIECAKRKARIKKQKTYPTIRRCISITFVPV